MLSCRPRLAQVDMRPHKRSHTNHGRGRTCRSFVLCRYAHVSRATGECTQSAYIKLITACNMRLICTCRQTWRGDDNRISGVSGHCHSIGPSRRVAPSRRLRQIQLPYPYPESQAIKARVHSESLHYMPNILQRPGTTQSDCNTYSKFYECNCGESMT